MKPEKTLSPDLQAAQPLLDVILTDQQRLPGEDSDIQVLISQLKKLNLTVNSFSETKHEVEYTLSPVSCPQIKINLNYNKMYQDYGAIYFEVRGSEAVKLSGIQSAVIEAGLCAEELPDATSDELADIQSKTFYLNSDEQLEYLDNDVLSGFTKLSASLAPFAVVLGTDIEYQEVILGFNTQNSIREIPVFFHLSFKPAATNITDISKLTPLFEMVQKTLES